MIPGSANPLLLKSAAAAGGLQIERSLRFNSSDSAYLSRTPGTAGNRRTWTLSFWAKFCEFANIKGIFSVSTAYMNLYGDYFDLGSTGTGSFSLYTTAFYRDPSAWYHFVVAFDTTQSTSSDRAKLYVNGVQQTLNGTGPGLNFEAGWNDAILHKIGEDRSLGRYLNGYLTNIHFIDGQALTPSSFTETDATTGQLIPKTYTGSYGTNGFNLLFADNSSNTASTLGKDSSPNGNNWTPNNFSVTAGAGNDSLFDFPVNDGTDTGVGGEVRGNYAVLSNEYGPSFKTRLSISNGNLDVTFNNSGSSSTALSSIGVSSGKWYAEFTCTQTGSYYAFVGIASISAQSNNIESLGYGDSYAYLNNSGNKMSNGSSVAYGATWTAGDVIGVALDLTAGTLTFYKNGTSQGQAYSSISGTYVIGCTGFLSWMFSANFGQRPFAYTAPSGFKALNTANLPSPLVTKSNTVFDVVTRTFTGASASITSLAFAPDFLWFKRRNDAASHSLFDSVRGVSGRLLSNGTNAEITVTDALTSFDSSGFTLGVDSGSISVNGPSSGTGVVWAWDAGTSTVSNTAGSITSQVRANATAGFSIVSYTSTGSTATVGHGLGVAPSMVITKCRSIISAFVVQHIRLAANNVLYLNGTDSSQDVSGSGAIPTPTSTVFSVNNQQGSNGISGTTMIAYCFAPVVGYSSFGSYTGNGSSDGSFVYTGFRPRWILIKETSGGESWAIFDTARNTYNTAGFFLRPDSSLQEHTSGSVDLDILSNGFKLRSTNATINAARTYIYAAFAEAPINYSRAR
jgi:hypothetical protein